MDHGDAVAQRVEGRGEPNFLAFELEGAGIRSVDAGDDLHQRRLAGAILAHQSMDMPAFKAKLHVVEREHAGESLADVFDFQQIFGAWDRPAFAHDLCGRRTEAAHRASSRTGFGLCSGPKQSYHMHSSRDERPGTLSDVSSF